MILSLLLACSLAPSPQPASPPVESAASVPASAPSVPGTEAAPSSPDSDRSGSTRGSWSHAGDRDMATFTAVWPQVTGTRLDDCQTCHCGGTDCAEALAGASPTTACEWCHLLPFGGEEVRPIRMVQTLDAFGAAYLAAGRDRAALEALATVDSDGDGYPNEQEIRAKRYPGSARSHPGQPRPPVRTVTRDDLSALPEHEVTLLVNVHSQLEDTYARFRGVRVTDLLASVGVDVADPGLSGITVFSPDGYRQRIEAIRLREAAPASQVYGGLGAEHLGPDCGFVRYGPGVEPGARLPPAPLLLGLERDGEPLEPVVLDARTGKIDGSGPLRLVVPQADPGPPDRGSNHSPSGCDDGHDYRPEADHNAGEMVRGVVAVRVDPLPQGLEDLDWYNGGWGWLRRGELAVYGRGVEVSREDGPAMGTE